MIDVEVDCDTLNRFWPWSRLLDFGGEIELRSPLSKIVLGLVEALFSIQGSVSSSTMSAAAGVSSSTPLLLLAVETMSFTLVHAVLARCVLPAAVVDWLACVSANSIGVVGQDFEVPPPPAVPGDNRLSVDLGILKLFDRATGTVGACNNRCWSSGIDLRRGGISPDQVSSTSVTMCYL